MQPASSRDIGPTSGAIGTSAPAAAWNQLTLFAEAFPASPTPWLVDAADLPTSATSGPTSLDSFASVNPDGSWRKTSQGYSQVTLDGSLEVFSETWPRAGMTRSGIAFQRAPLAPLTGETASGLLPTPKKGDAEQGANRTGRSTAAQTIKAGWNLIEAVRFWPTPCTTDAKSVPYQKGKGNKRYPMLLGAVRPETMWPTPKSSASGPDYARRDREGSGGDDLATAIGGQLNPTWVEWLMGYPLGWTACATSAMRSSRRSRNGSRAASSPRKE